MTLVQIVKDFECECGHKLSFDLSVEGNLSDFQATITCPKCNKVHVINKETLFRSSPVSRDESTSPSNLNLSSSLLDNNSNSSSSEDHSADIAGFFDGL